MLIFGNQGKDMTKSVNRPERIAPSELDVALTEALERAKQVTEISKDELESVAGGFGGGLGGPTAGMYSQVK
jgi:hypothetical protein